MRIKVVVIDFELPRWAKKALVFAGIPVAMILGLSALGRADTVTFNAYSSGEMLTHAKLNQNLQGLADAINNPNPDCPRGYAKTGTAASFLAASVVCAKTGDEVVRVGTGASAFWIDRYEASVWTAASGGSQIADDNAGAYAAAGLPQNGQVLTPLYARSVPNVMPSRQLTWFQAVEACAASGKQLPDGVQWLRAARGTVDPDANNGLSNKKCNTSGTGPRNTGSAADTSKTASCISDWGAEDMIGNLTEVTAEWHAGVGALTVSSPAGWPTGYNSDGTYNISSSARLNSGPVVGLPVAAQHGGSYGDGNPGGVFFLSLEQAPARWAAGIGFRCVLIR